MKSHSVDNRKILLRAFCSLVKIQTVKRGKVLRVKLSADMENKSVKLPRTLRRLIFSAEMEGKSVDNQKILRQAFCSHAKLQIVKRGKVLRVKFSARNEKQNCQNR